MLLIELWSNAIWLIQLRGIATLMKLAALLFSMWAGTQSYIIIPVIIISGVISHAPGKVRYFFVIPLRVFNQKVIHQSH